MKKTTKKTPSPAPATRRASAPTTAPKAAPAAPKANRSGAKLAPAASPKALSTGPILGLGSQVAPPRPRTVINARTDVGFGNTLFIRGDGPGLNWEKGAPLDCIASDHWKIELEAGSRPVVFKLLINDEQWNSGPDYTAEVSSTATVHPEF